MSQLSFGSLCQSREKAARAAPLIHKWFARRRPEAIERVLAGLPRAESRSRMRVLDPFAGSGMILLASLMAGHDVYGIDINPVAWLIARQTLNPPDVKELEATFHQIDEAVGSEIRQLYKTYTPMVID